MKKVLLIVWFLAYKVAWLSCVLGGGVYGYPILGGIPMLIWVAAWIAMQPNRRQLLYTSGVSLLYGIVFDSALVLSDTMIFPPASQTGTPSPLWMMILWLGFGAIYEKSLGFLKDRWILLFIIGAVGGPMAYLGGVNMEALEIGRTKTDFVLLIGLEWAIALPLFMWYSQRYASADTRKSMAV